MIRVATPLDLDAIMELGQSIGLQSEFQRGVTLDVAHMRTVAEKLLASSDVVIVVAERQHQVIGMLGVAIYPHLLSAQTMAAQLFWWVQPEHRDGVGRHLLTAAEQIVKDRGAHALQMTAPTHAFAATLERDGYRKTADVYEKGLI